jgi:hypothetical protein
MKLHCSNCKIEIKTGNINILNDSVKCEKCGTITKASTLNRQFTPLNDMPPHGSKMEFIKGVGKGFEITSPRIGLTIQKIPILTFNIIWISFVSYWTILAYKGSIIFAIFSIPFWFLGFTMLFSILKLALTSYKLNFDGIELTIVKKSLFRNKYFKYRLNEILAINMSKPLTNNPFMGFSNIGNSVKGNFNLPNLVSI